MREGGIWFVTSWKTTWAVSVTATVVKHAICIVSLEDVSSQFVFWYSSSSAVDTCVIVSCSHVELTLNQFFPSIIGS